MELIAITVFTALGCIIPHATTAVSSVVRFKTRTGARNHGGRLSSYEVKSNTKCALRCVQHQECNSYNLGPVSLNDGATHSGRNSRSCELVKTDHNSLATITEEAGWSFFINNSVITGSMLYPNPLYEPKHTF